MNQTNELKFPKSKNFNYYTDYCETTRKQFNNFRQLKRLTGIKTFFPKFNYH